MATSNDSTASNQTRIARVVPYEMDHNSFLLWTQSIAMVIERLNEDPDGTPDIEIRHLAQVQQYLAGQMAAAVESGSLELRVTHVHSGGSHHD